MNKFLRISVRTILWSIAGILILLLSIIFLIRIPKVQNYIVGKATHYLEEKLNTKVEIGYVNISFPKNIVLENVNIEDLEQNPLIKGKRLYLDISMFQLLKNTVEIQEIQLEGIHSVIKRDENEVFNFVFIVDAFSDGESVDDPNDDTPPMKINIEKVKFDDIHFLYEDHFIGLSTDVSLDYLRTHIKKFDLTDNMAFSLPNIEINGLKTVVKQWSITPADSMQTTNTEDDTYLFPDIELGKIKLSNIAVGYEDEAGGLGSIVEVEKLNTDIKNLDLNGERIDFGSILLDGALAKVIFEKNEKALFNKIAEDTDSTSSNMNWQIGAEKIQIKNTQVAYTDENEERMKGLDYFNLHMSDINGDLQDFFFSTDSISGSLKTLSAIDHSGFTLKELKTDFEYTSTGVKFKNLLAETPTTRLQDLLEISYPSLDVIDTHPEQIFINANLRKSQLDMKDIYYFAPFLDTMEVMKPLMDKKFKIDSRVSGRVNNLSIPKFEFSTLDQTSVSASATIRGLPNTDKLYIDLVIKNLNTSKKDIDRLVAPTMMPDNIRIPEKINAHGFFKGGLNAFNTDLSLKTDRGDAVLIAEYAVKGSDTTYNADIMVSDFDAGYTLMQDSIMGLVGLHAHVEGTGIDPKTMVASASGALDKMDAMGYPYRDISFDLNANNGEASGKIDSPDPNIQFRVDLVGDLSSTYPKIKMDMMVDSINLQNLKLMDEDFRYHGKLVADIETADIDYLNGSIKLINSSIAYDKNRLVLDTVSLVATADSSRNELLLNSAPLTAQMVGKFKLSQLSHAIEDIVRIYYNPYKLSSDTLQYEPQNFEFSARLAHSAVIKEFIPELVRLDPITLDGNFDSESQTLIAKLTAPKVIYNDITLDKIGLDIVTVDSVMYYSGLLEKIQSGNIVLENTTISGDVKENNVGFGAWIKDKEGKNQYHLGAHLFVDRDNYIVHLKEDGFMLNYDKWDIQKDNALVFGKDDIKAHNFTLSSEDQLLSITSHDSTAFSPLDVNFENFRIETLSKILESENFKLGGGINGVATISSLNERPTFVSDLTIDKFFLGNDIVGNIDLLVNNEVDNEFATDIKIYGNDNDVRLVGKVLMLNSGPMGLDLNLDLQPLTVKTLEAFSFGNLQKSKGNIRGEVKITGTTDNPLLNGDLNFENAVLNATMLNSDMFIDNQKITFNNTGINFRNFDIKDQRQNSIRVNGQITTDDYRDYGFNLTVNSNDFEAINSTREHNDLFFGKLFLTTNLRIRGDIEKPIVDGSINVNERTDLAISIPDENPGQLGSEGVVKFVNKRDTVAYNIFGRLDSVRQVEKISGMDLNLTLRTDPKAKFRIILDEGSEEALHIQGVAQLNAGLDASDKITMSGTYTVEDGHYALTFGPVTRSFSFQKGSVITWNGDPLDARMNITAVYQEKFPTLELVQNQVSGESANLYKQRVPFSVKLILTGELFKPLIQFDIELNEDQAIVSQDVANKVKIALSTIREDPAELNKQVFSLIVLGRFMASNPFESLSGGGGAEGVARSTVTSLLSSQLNALASNLIHGVELDFDLQSEEDYLTGTGQNRTDLTVGLSKTLLDDRLKITIGSNFEVEGGARPGEKSNNIAGDITLDYQLSKDGRYYARIYRKNQYQATLQGQFIETGIGFIINMDYNHFKELFMSSKALQNYYNTDTRSFRRRFDVERMETDSVYRDSVRNVIRDSLRNDPRYQRMRRREREEIDPVDINSEDNTEENSDTKENTQQDVSTFTPINRNEDEHTFHYED